MHKFNKNICKQQLQNLYFFMYVKIVKQQNKTNTTKQKIEQHANTEKKRQKRIQLNINKK